MHKFLSRFVQWIRGVHLPRALFLAVVVGVLLRYGTFAYVVLRFGTSGLLFPDSPLYVHLAENMARYGVFSASDVAHEAVLPWTFHVPGLMAALAASIRLFGSWVWWIPVQIACASLLPLLGVQIAQQLGLREREQHIVAWLLAIEPVLVWQSVYVITEPMHTVFLAVTALCFLLGHRRGSAALFFLAGLSLGAATLVRASGQILIVPLCAIALLCFGRAARVRTNGVWAVSVLLGYALLVMPWLLRNASVSGHATLATAGWADLNSDYGGSIYAVQHNLPFHVAKHIVEAESAALLGISEEALRAPAYAPQVRALAVSRIWQHPKEALLVQGMLTAAFLTQDTYATYLQRLQVMPRFTLSFSPSLALVQKGVLATVRDILASGRGWVFVPLIGRLVWLCIFCLALVGGVVVLRTRTHLLAWGVVFCILFGIYAVSSVIGLGVEARLRAPVNLFYFLFAVKGYAYVSDTWRRHTRARA